MPNKKVGIGLETKVNTTAAQKATAALSKQFKTLANQGVSVGKAFGGMGAALARVNPIAFGAVAGFKLLAGGIKGIISLGATAVRTIIAIGRSLLEADKSIRVFNASLRQVQRAGGATGASFETLSNIFNNLSLQTGKSRNDLVDLAIKLRGIGAGQRETVSALVAASNASDVLGKSFREVGEAIFTAENVSTRALSKLGVNVSNLTQEFLSQEGAIKLVTEQFGDQVVQLGSISILAERIGNAFKLARDNILEVVLSSTTVQGTFQSVFAALIGFVQNLKQSPEIAKALSAVFDNIVKLLLSLAKLLPDILNLALSALQAFLETTGLLGTTVNDVHRASVAVLASMNIAQGNLITSRNHLIDQDKETLRIADELLSRSTAINKNQEERLATLRKTVKEYERGAELQKNFQTARDAIVQAGRTLTSGSGGTTLQEALKILQEEFAKDRKQLNNDSKTSLKETLKSLDGLKRSNELRSLDVKEQLLQNGAALYNLLNDQGRFAKKAPEGTLSSSNKVFTSRGDRFGGFGTPARNANDLGKLSSQFVKSISQGLGAFGKENVANLSDRISKIINKANDKLLDKNDTLRLANASFYKTREALLKKSLKLDEQNVKRQLAATSQAERDQIQHETNLAQRQITIELQANTKFIKANEDVAKRNTDRVLKKADEQVEREKQKALEDAAKEKAAIKRREERNKQLMGVLFAMADALASLATDESINEEIDKLRKEYEKSVDKSLKESMKAGEAFSKQNAKNAKELAESIDKLEQERHKELVRIEEDRSRNLQQAIDGFSGDGTAADRRKLQKELDDITIASERSRNQFLERSAQQIEELNKNAMDQFETEQEAYNEQEMERRAQRKLEFEQAEKSAQEVQDKAVEGARKAGEQFGDAALKGILNAFFPGAGDIVSALNKVSGASQELAMNFGRGIADFVGKALSNLIGNIPGIVGAIIAGFIEGIPDIVEGISEGVRNLIGPSTTSGIIRVGASAVGAVGGIFNWLDGDQGYFAETAAEVLGEEDYNRLNQRFDSSGRIINPTDGRTIEQITEGMKEGLKEFDRESGKPFTRPEEFALFNRQRVDPNFTGRGGQRALIAALDKQIEELRRNSEALKENTEATGFADDEFGQPPQLRPGFRRAREAFNPYLDPSAAPGADSTPVNLKIQIGDQKLRDILFNLQESGYTQLVRAY